MTDDVLALLRSLPPDLPEPANRVQEVRARVVQRRRRQGMAATVIAVAAVTVPLSLLPSGEPAPVATPPSGEPAPVAPPPPSPLACPQVHTGASPWVPDQPRGVDGRSRLVPPAPPTSALLCAYNGANVGERTGWALTGSRELSGGLDRLAADLTLVAPSGAGGMCTLKAGPQVNYLLGLSYEGGTLWVSTADEPNNCAAAGNGQFTGRLRDGGVAKAVAAAYTAGAWSGPQPPPTDSPCSDDAVGRLGQESVLIPADPVSVTICQEVGSTDVRSVTLSSGFTDLVEAVNQLPTRVSRSGCTPVASRSDNYRLLFRYADGPSVLVHVLIGCEPAIDNGSIAADDATPVQPIIDQLLDSG